MGDPILVGLDNRLQTGHKQIAGHLGHAHTLAGVLHAGDVHIGTEELDAAIAALKNGDDFAAIHVEAPDEMGHQGIVEHKVQAIEWLDSRIVAPIVQTLRERGEDFRMLILSDHKTFLAGGAHGGDLLLDAVLRLFALQLGGLLGLTDDAVRLNAGVHDDAVAVAAGGSGLGYTEENGGKGPFLPDGTMLMPLLFET